jgi:hypothetical protein
MKVLQPTIKFWKEDGKCKTPYWHRSKEKTARETATSQSFLPPRMKAVARHAVLLVTLLATSFAGSQKKVASTESVRIGVLTYQPNPQDGSSGQAAFLCLDQIDPHRDIDQKGQAREAIRLPSGLQKQEK